MLPVVSCCLRELAGERIHDDFDASKVRQGIVAKK
jgi:hypothetical protein